MQGVMESRGKSDGFLFGPRSCMSNIPKATGGLSLRKPQSRFKSDKMNKMYKEFQKAQQNMKSAILFKKQAASDSAMGQLNALTSNDRLVRNLHNEHVECSRLAGSIHRAKNVDTSSVDVSPSCSKSKGQSNPSRRDGIRNHIRMRGYSNENKHEDRNSARPSLQMVGVIHKPIKRRKACIEGSQVRHEVGGSDQVSLSMNCAGRQCYCSKPIVKPAWSGLFKIDGKEYISLVGHLSTRSCEKVWSLSGSLSRMVEVREVPKLAAWPERWDAPNPTGDSIGLYFFPPNRRHDTEVVDQLVKELIDNDMVLRSVFGRVEMLVFPSVLLPKQYQTFQGKHYLWGVFKPKEGAITLGPNTVSADGAALPETHGPFASTMGAPRGSMYRIVVQPKQNLEHKKVEKFIQDMKTSGALVSVSQVQAKGSGPCPTNTAPRMQ